MADAAGTKKSSRRVMFFAVNASTKKVSCHVILFCSKCEYGFHAITAKKHYTNYNIHCSEHHPRGT